jgi:hypothetical protein
MTSSLMVGIRDMLLDYPVEPLGGLALLGHNRNRETRRRDGYIDACGLERPQPHWPLLDGSELPTHNS